MADSKQSLLPEVLMSYSKNPVLRQVGFSVEDMSQATFG